MLIPNNYRRPNRILWGCRNLMSIRNRVWSSEYKWIFAFICNPHFLADKWVAFVKLLVDSSPFYWYSLCTYTSWTSYNTILVWSPQLFRYTEYGHLLTVSPRPDTHPWLIIGHYIRSGPRSSEGRAECIPAPRRTRGYEAKLGTVRGLAQF